MKQQLNIELFAQRTTPDLTNAIWHLSGEYLIACDETGRPVSDGDREIRRKEVRITFTEKEFRKADKEQEIASGSYHLPNGRIGAVIYTSSQLLHRSRCCDGMTEHEVSEAVRHYLIGGRAR